MHPADRFDCLTLAVSELLAEHAGRISDTDLDELADLIADFVSGRERDQARADLQKIEEWLDRIAFRLRARQY